MSPPNQGYKYKASLTAAASDGTGTLVAACGSSRGGGIQLSGTFSATIQFEQSLDNGTTWIAKTVYPAAGGAGVTSATGTGQWKLACGGETQIRVRCSAYTSGTVVVDATFTAGLDESVIIPTAVGGGVTWGTPTAVAMTGSSKTFVPANAARKELFFWSTAANSPAAFDLAGGVVTLAGGIPLYAGASPTVLTGGDCPVGIVSAIGTSTQNLYYVEGT